MPTPLSPIRIAHATAFVVAIDSTEEQEIDFELGVQQGIEVYEILTLPEVGLDATAAVANEAVEITAHVETGTLEDPSPAADGVIQNSEIIHHCLVEGFIEPANDVIAQLVVTNPKTSFLERMGQPLLVAQNITMRYQTGVLMASLSFVETYITYRYVRLTEAELVNQLLQRR